MISLEVKQRSVKESPAKLRRGGFLPAVMYGRDDKATPITVDMRTFDKVFKTAGESTIINLTGEGEGKQALIHEVAFDAVTGRPIHVDFYLIAKGQTVTVSVPLEFTGSSPAVKDQGGILVKVMHDLEIEVPPQDLPSSIEVDTSKLVALDSQILVGDLKIPASAKVSVPMDEVVAMISVAKDEPVEEAPMDISQIEVEKKGKTEEEGAPEGGSEAEKKE